MQDTVIISLLQKYIKDQCTEQELRTLLQWLKSPDNHIDLDLVVQPLWDAIDKDMSHPNEERENELRREVSSLLSEIKQKNKFTSNSRVRSKNRLNGFYRVAAILILAFSVTLGLLKVLDRPQPVVTYAEKMSAKGEKKSLLLADGTKVILNSDTKLIIPSNFNKLTVSTGKVRVNVADQDLQLAVSPNEHLSINKIDGNVRKESIEENNYIKWIHGSLYFNKEPIREVIKTINRTYNRKVILQCKNCDYRITGTHDNKSIEAVIEAICFTTGLRSKREGGNIILYEKH